MEFQRHHLQTLVNLNTGVYAFQAVTFAVILLIGVYIKCYLREPRRCHQGINGFRGHYNSPSQALVECGGVTLNASTLPHTYTEAVQLETIGHEYASVRPLGVNYAQANLC